MKELVEWKHTSKAMNIHCGEKRKRGRERGGPGRDGEREKIKETVNIEGVA